VTHLDDAVAACAAKIAAQQAGIDAQRRLEAALRGMVADGIPQARVAERLHERLAVEFTPEQIEAMGVGKYNVRRLLDRMRPE
jgi:hypothetical protein